MIRRAILEEDEVLQRNPPDAFSLCRGGD